MDIPVEPSGSESYTAQPDMNFTWILLCLRSSLGSCNDLGPEKMRRVAINNC